MGIAPELQPGLVRSEARRADNADIVRLAAVLDGDVVGTTVLITAHDVAGIFLVHVAAPHRRGGIGAALTSAALDVAHDRGTHLAALIASPRPVNPSTAASASPRSPSTGSSPCPPDSRPARGPKGRSAVRGAGSGRHRRGRSSRGPGPVRWPRRRTR
ncbi:GNAT family N-acetyltransferase [Streptomyces sp. NPDC001902]